MAVPINAAGLRVNVWLAVYVVVAPEVILLKETPPSVLNCHLNHLFCSKGSDTTNCGLGEEPSTLVAGPLTSTRDSHTWIVISSSPRSLPPATCVALITCRSTVAVEALKEPPTSCHWLS